MYTVVNISALPSWSSVLWSSCHSCQAQAEGLVNDIHVKEIELESLNGLCRRIDTNTAEMNATRNRYNRTNSQKGPLYSDYIVDPYDKPPYNASGRVESLQRQMLMRSAFVLYILLLHILVFIRISFWRSSCNTNYISPPYKWISFITLRSSMYILHARFKF